MIELVSHGTQDFCSGACPFCHAKPFHASIDYSSEESIIRDLKAVDKANYNKFEANYGKLEKLLDKVKFKDTLDVSFWGGDPLTNFEVLQDQVDFMEWYSTKINKPIMMHASSNGLALLRNEIYDYCKQHHIHFQLSHDGLGQEFRTKSFDPLDNETVRKAIEEGMITSIHCVMNKFNCSPLLNAEYFSAKLPKKIGVGLDWVREHDYDLDEKNETGLFNGKHYEGLKGKRLGDLSIQNDWTLAKESGVYGLGNAADIFFDELLEIYENIENYSNFSRPLAKRFFKLIGEVNDSNRNSCSAFAKGTRSDSRILDSKGEYCSCHVLDSDGEHEDPEIKGEAWCSECRYRDRWLCAECGILSKDRNGCSFRYRMNALADHLKKDPYFLGKIRRAMYGKKA